MTIADYVIAIAQSPLLWIGATVFYLIAAIWVGVSMPRRWHNMALWVPIALLAALALRPYPNQKSHHPQQSATPAPASDEWHEVDDIDPPRLAAKDRDYSAE